MKIPETSANVGAYYGNEENGQWQPNGLIVDSGVGGGVVGSGDAGAHPTSLYPVHVRHGHIPGYVMAGAYYPPAGYPAPAAAPPHDDFEDYMWMENEEEFDKQVMQQLEEEALMEQCIEAMLEDEQRERLHRPTANGHTCGATTSNGVSSLSLEETVSRSTLNPLAAEFVPTTVRSPSTTQVKSVPAATEAPSDDTSHSEDVASTDKQEVSTTLEDNSKEATPPQTEPPEVSAADIQPITDTHKQTDKPTDPKTKLPAKKAIKTDIKSAKEVKAKKSAPVKVESKPIAKKKEIRSVQSEEKAEETTVEQSPPVQTPPTTEEPQSGFKPINYAAAAKANKPRKPNEKTPPPSIVEKTPSVKSVADKTSVKVTAEKSSVKVTADKPSVKVAADKTSVKVDKVIADKKAASKSKITEKVVQRKNSTK